MMYLFGYLIIAILLMFSCQATAKNECEKDPIKTGQELLASAQTLLHGENFERFDSDMAIKWLQKYAFGVLCCQNIEPKFEMNANFKNLQKNFCQKLENGKSIEEAAKNVQDSAINLMQNLDKANILKNIRQKIAENLFLDEKNKKKMAQFLGHFEIGIDKFYGVIKARKVLCGAQQPKTDQKNAVLMRQRRRKRRDVNPTIIYGDNSGSSSGGRTCCAVFVTSAIMVFLTGIASQIHQKSFEMFAPCAVLFLICVVLAIIFCYLYRD